jgi:hypothetical protein
MPAKDEEGNVERDGKVRRPDGLKEKTALSEPFLEKRPLIKGLEERLSSKETLTKEASKEGAEKRPTGREGIKEVEKTIGVIGLKILGERRRKNLSSAQTIVSEPAIRSV